jgi:hypothetical protein
MPPPCSTDSQAGTWTSAELSLSAGELRVVPVSGGASVWAIGECVDIRPFNARDAMERGIPSATSSDGTAAEVIELEFENTIKRYLGVDSVADRLGWIAALWDAMISARRSTRVNTPAQPVYEENTTYSPICTPFSMGLQSSGPLFIRNRDATPNSISTFRITSNTTSKASPRLESALRHSVQGMFADQEGLSRPTDDPAWTDGRPDEQLKRQSTEGIPAERELSIFSRSRSIARARSTRGFNTEISSIADDRSEGLPSFDESDLNPSRSASQRAAPLREEFVGIQDMPRRITTIRQGPSRRLPQPKMPSLLGTRPVPTGPVESGYFDGVRSNTVRATPKMEQGEREIATDGALTALLATREVTPLMRSIPSDEDFKSALPERFPVPLEEETSAHTGLPTSPVEKSASSPSHENLISSPSEGLARAVTGDRRFHPEHSDESLHAQLEAVRAEARLAFTQSKLLQEQTEAIQNQAEAVKALSPLVGKVDAAHLDIKGIQNTLQIAALAALKEGQTPTVDLEEVHSKLDRLMAALQDLSAAKASVPSVSAAPAESSPPAASTPLPAIASPSEQSTTGVATQELPAESEGSQSQLLDQVSRLVDIDGSFSLTSCNLTLGSRGSLCGKRYAGCAPGSKPAVG